MNYNVEIKKYIVDDCLSTSNVMDLWRVAVNEGKDVEFWNAFVNINARLANGFLLYALRYEVTDPRAKMRPVDLRQLIDKAGAQQRT